MKLRYWFKPMKSFLNGLKTIKSKYNDVFGKHEDCEWDEDDE